MRIDRNLCRKYQEAKLNMQIEEKEPIRVLITGAHSYIGTSFEKWVSENCTRIQTDTLDIKKTD